MLRPDITVARVRFQTGDFFADPLPAADVLVMGDILYDWGIDDKRKLLQRAVALVGQERFEEVISRG